MKRALQRNFVRWPNHVFLVLLLSLFVLIPASFSAETTQSDDSSKTPSKSTPRPLPVQNIFDPNESKVEAVADSLEYQKDTGKLIARGNAVITYQGTKIVADYAEVETDAKKAYAKGHVLIFRKNVPRLQGEEVYYNFGNHTGSFPNAKAINPPFVARGSDIEQVREGVEKIRGGSITTCKLDKPHYQIRCKKATLYMDEKLIMYNATIYVLGVPVFWLPIMNFPLNWPQMPVQAKTGFSTQYGAYIELTKGVTFNQHLAGKAHLDWRSKRGVGGGWDQYYQFGKYAHGNIKLYLTQDKDAPTPGYVDPGSGDANPYAQRESRTRGRITWRHRTDIDDYTHVLLRYHRASDQYFLQDFNEHEYYSSQQPTSFVTATHNTENYGAMLHLEKKMNSYESMVERMPEARLDWKNQPFLKELVFNESRVQFDNLNIVQPHSTLHQGAARGDVYSRWFMPLKWKDINFMPFAGYRGTEYSHILNSNAARFRNAIEYGTDLRTHFYKMFDVSFDKLGIEVNQLRHVAEPSITYKGVNSTVSNDKLIHFDTVDTIGDANQVVFGLENRLQTKRVVNGKVQRVDIVSLNTFLNFEAKPQDPTTPQNTFTSFDNTLTLRPYDWLQFQTKLVYDFSLNFLKIANNDLLIRKGKWKLIFGYRYIHEYYNWYDVQQIPGGSELVFDTRYQINRLWEVGGYVRYDTATSGIQEYQVSATRDLHDFILDFGWNVRNSWINNNNKQLFFSIRMKGIPGFELHGGGGRATFSEPRLGETVAGANEGAGRFGTASYIDQSPLLSAQN